LCHARNAPAFCTRLRRFSGPPRPALLTLPLHDALPIYLDAFQDVVRMLYYLTGMATERSAVLAYNLLHDGVAELGEDAVAQTVIDRKSTRLNSSHVKISYAVFCLKKQKHQSGHLPRRRL